MINVCYTVDAPFVGGAETYVSRIATRLDRGRFRPMVIMRKASSPGTGLEEWAAELKAAGVPVEALPMDLPKKPFQLYSVLRAISATNPHVVHVNMPGPQDGQMGLLVPVSRMAGATSVIVTEHLPMVESTWKRRLIKRFSYLWVDRVATVCHANVPYLTGKQFVPEGKVAVIHNAVDGGYGTRFGPDKTETRKKYRFPADRIVIAFVGNLLEHKGLHRVVEVLSEMPGLPWHLAVIGDGPERTRNEKQLESNGLAGRATFAGKVPGDEVERILSAVDMLVLPSTTEGMPYVILEAMASSVPVVATGVFGIPEMVVDGETGLLVKTDDTPGFGQAIKSLLENPVDRESMGFAARSRFERLFTLEGQLARIEQLYTEVAGCTSVNPRNTGSA